MKKNQIKRYFIKDTSLHSVDGDMFNYADMSKVLGRVIETNIPPYNIAIIGKWGLGKSSLINLVTDKYKNKDGYIIQEINAWKYEKDSLTKVFLKQLWQGISGKKFKSFQVIQREFSEIVNGDVIGTPSKDTKKNNRKLLITAGVIALITVITFIIYKLIQAIILGSTIFEWTFWGEVFLSYCKNIATVLLFPVLIGVCKLVMDEYYSKETRKIELNFPLESADDYEIFLETKIQEKLIEHPNLKVITVIDDLDRLSIEKIVEALNALKAFVGFERCIFIVPFDDEIIKLALEKRRIEYFDDSNEIIESELILDKLFQFKLYLPPLLKFDIKQYAIDLVQQEIPDFLTEYCSLDTMQNLLSRIIIHSGVTTPRQVKKLINSFVNNYMVASERENSGKVQKGLFTSEFGQQQIAKISVLQADFNQFYDLLFEDFGYLRKILECHNKSLPLADTPDSLIKYFLFSNDGKNIKIKPEYEDLINFLIRTAKFDVDNIATYLYLAQDKISKNTGDEVQRRAFNALESGNVETLSVMLKESPALAESISYYLSESNDETLDVLTTAVAIFVIVYDEYKNGLARNILDRTLEIKDDKIKFMYKLSAESIFSIADQIDETHFKESFINIYLTCLSKTDWIEVQTLITALEIILTKWSSLLDSSKDIIMKITELCIDSEEVPANKLVFAVNFSSSTLFNRLWGIKWFDKLCKYIETRNDFSDEIITNFIHTFNYLVNDKNINDLVIILRPLIGYAALLPTFNKILTKTICESMTDTDATIIANTVLKLDYGTLKNEIHEMLSKLNYIITEDNSEEFSDFTTHYAETSLMDEVLVYCGKQEYFEMLDSTIVEIIEVVFENEENDSLLDKIQDYLTDTQRSDLFTTLKAKSVFNASVDYSRFIQLFSILSRCDKNKDHLNDIALTTLVPQLNSRLNVTDYFDFVSQSMGYIKSCLQTSTIDSYVTIIINNINSSRSMCLKAIDRLNGFLSINNFTQIFPLITTAVQPADLEMTLNILINNNKIRPKELNTEYRNFLVNYISEALNPDKFIDTISSSFKYISNLKELITSSQMNSAVSRDKLLNAIIKCFNNYPTIDMVSIEVLGILEKNETYDLICETLDKITSYKIDDIFNKITNTISELNHIDVLLNLMKLANRYSNLTNLQLLIKILELTFKHDNQPVKVAQVIREANNFSSDIIKNARMEIAVVLHSGFSETTSEDVKGVILSFVSSKKIRQQFRSQLNKEEMEYYKKWLK